MSQHLEKILAHAERQLVSQGKERLRAQLDLYKKFLKLEEHRQRERDFNSRLDQLRERVAGL